MIKNMIFEYVLTLFDESRDGVLTVGDDDERIDCLVEWNAETANSLAGQCSELVVHLTELAGQYDSLQCGTRCLTRDQKIVWKTYLAPFSEHGIDNEDLNAACEKHSVGEKLTEYEQTILERYRSWYNANALARLPYNRCSPTDLINRAKRYAGLVRLGAPIAVQENEAKRFAEELVLYHCMR